MPFEIMGKVLTIGEIVQRTEKFSTRELVLDTSEVLFNGEEMQNYTNMQMVNKKTDLTNSINVGDIVKVKFAINGNKAERDGKVSYFQNLNVISITVLEKVSDNTIRDSAPTAPMQQIVSEVVAQQNTIGSVGDLPF